MIQKISVVPISYIRSLLVAQNGRCAISGRVLTPTEVNADHMIPLSRTELFPKFDHTNIWLLHKNINQMKGTMTYDEMIACCRHIIAYELHTRRLLFQVQQGAIPQISKADFDIWAREH